MSHADPTLPRELVKRILPKLGLAEPPSPDLVGLNALYAAWSGGITFDNVQKRIWFAGDRTTPVTGGDPVEFFENWLTHGTGGTCWPTSGAIHALLRSLGFDARRIAGAMIDPGADHTDTEPDNGNPAPADADFEAADVGTELDDTAPEPGDADPEAADADPEADDADPAGHGTVLVTLEGVDYLVDASMLAFEVLPLVPGVPARAGEGIHAIRAVPTTSGFDVLWYPGHLRKAPTTFRTQARYDRVSHAFFLEGYERSKEHGPFNDALYICRRRRDSIVSIGRKNRISVSADGRVTRTALSDSERKRVLVEEFDLSREIVAAVPRDVVPEDTSQ